MYATVLNFSGNDTDINFKADKSRVFHSEASRALADGHCDGHLSTCLLSSWTPILVSQCVQESYLSGLWPIC